MDVTNATFTSHDWTHFKYPLSLSPIPRSMKPGIIALCVFAFISCATTLSLLSLLTYRFITSRNDHRAPLYKNQYILLIYSLVLADFQCDLGFFLDVVWLHKDQIIAPSVPCFVQAWLINIGDLSSGFFVFAIACHTFYNIVFGRRLGLTTLCWCIVGLWILAVILTCIPIILHPKNIFVTQGNWVCIPLCYHLPPKTLLEVLLGNTSLIETFHSVPSMDNMTPSVSTSITSGFWPLKALFWACT